MPLQINFEPNDVCVLRMSGVLTRSEFAESQRQMAEKIDHGAKPRLLAILEDFHGWQRGADWNDLDFLISHGGKIAKIAIVTGREWETGAFAGAGVRRAPVKVFPPGKADDARNWLAQ